MAGSLGALVISIEANMAKFQSEMTKSAYITEQAMNKMAAGANLAQTAIKGLATGLIAGIGANAFGTIVNAVNRTVDSLAKLDDMSQKTGASVENLSKLGKVASTFGQNFEEVDAALSKLAKGMNGVDEEGSKVKAGLDALGISTKNLKDQDPSEVFVQVARKLQDYRDGVGKTALITDVLGKSAANIIPYMNDVADNIEKFKGVSAEAAQQASLYQDQLGMLKNKHAELVQSIVIDALPAMISFTKAMLEARGESDALGNNKSIVTWGDTMARVAAFVVDSFNAVISVFQIVGTTIAGLAAGATLSFQGNLKGTQDVLTQMKKDIEDIRQKKSVMKALEDQIASRPTADAKAADAKGKVEKPALKYTSPKAAGAANTDDPSRKLRDAALKQIENSLAAERDALRFHDDYMSELRSQDLIDFKTYEEAKQFSRDAELAAAVSAYDKEITILLAGKAKTDKLKEKADADLKIEEVRGKKDKAIADAAQKNVMALTEQTRAQSELRKSMEDWSRQQTQNLDQMQQDVDMMGMSQVEIAKLIAARRILLDVEEQIRRAKEKGTVSEDDIEGYRKQAAAAVKRSNAVYEAGDAKQKDPWFNMSESVRKYGEEAANVGQQIGDAMTNAFHGAEDALVNFAMTGKLSFGDLAKSILADLARIQAKNLIASLTGAGNSGAGALGGGLGGLFQQWGTMAGAGGASSATGGMGIMGDVLVASAAGGFDIPAGSNPMTQLHEKEMVLPKQHADVIRGLASGGGGGGGITLNPVYNIQIESETDRAAIRADVQRAVKQGNAELVDQLSRAGKI